MYFDMSKIRFFSQQSKGFINSSFWSPVSLAMGSRIILARYCNLLYKQAQSCLKIALTESLLYIPIVCLFKSLSTHDRNNYRLSTLSAFNVSLTLLNKGILKSNFASQNHRLYFKYKLFTDVVFSNRTTKQFYIPGEISTEFCKQKLFERGSDLF